MTGMILRNVFATAAATLALAACHRPEPDAKYIQTSPSIAEAKTALGATQQANGFYYAINPQTQDAALILHNNDYTFCAERPGIHDQIGLCKTEVTLPEKNIIIPLPAGMIDPDLIAFASQALETDPHSGGGQNYAVIRRSTKSPGLNDRSDSPQMMAYSEQNGPTCTYTVDTLVGRCFNQNSMPEQLTKFRAMQLDHWDLTKNPAPIAITPFINPYSP